MLFLLALEIQFVDDRGGEDLAGRHRWAAESPWPTEAGTAKPGPPKPGRPTRATLGETAIRSAAIRWTISFGRTTRTAATAVRRTITLRRTTGTAVGWGAILAGRSARAAPTSSAGTKAARPAWSGSLLDIFETLFLLRREHLAEFFVDVFLQVGLVLLLLVRQLERLDDRSRHDLAGLRARAKTADAAPAETASLPSATPLWSAGSGSARAAISRPHEARCVSAVDIFRDRLRCPSDQFVPSHDAVMVRVRVVEHPLQPGIGDFVASEFAVFVLVERHHPRNESIRRRRFVDFRISAAFGPPSRDSSGGWANATEAASPTPSVNSKTLQTIRMERSFKWSTVNFDGRRKKSRPRCAGSAAVARRFLRRAAKHDVHPGRQLAGSRFFQRLEIDEDEFFLQRPADVLKDPVGPILRIAVNEELSREQLAASLF